MSPSSVGAALEQLRTHRALVSADTAFAGVGGLLLVDLADGDGITALLAS